VTTQERQLYQLAALCIVNLHAKSIIDELLPNTVRMRTQHACTSMEARRRLIRTWSIATTAISWSEMFHRPSSIS
jgi:hypothetical protein